jgi:hypothetical protein
VLKVPRLLILVVAKVEGTLHLGNERFYGIFEIAIAESLQRVDSFSIIAKVVLSHHGLVVIHKDH